MGAKKGKLVPFGDNLNLPGVPEIKPNSNAAVAAILLKTRELARHANVEDPETLFACLDRYLEFCIATNIKITNRSLYAACGVTEDMVTDWITGRSRSADPRYKEFAKTARAICSQSREQSAADGLLSPILLIWWQKNYDGFRDIPAVQREQNSELERTVDPAEIAAKYKHLLTDDSGERMERDKAEREAFEATIDEAYFEENGVKRRRQSKADRANAPTSAKKAPKTQGKGKKGKSPAKKPKRKEGAK